MNTLETKSSIYPQKINTNRNHIQIRMFFNCFIEFFGCTMIGKFR